MSNTSVGAFFNYMQDEMWLYVTASCCTYPHSMAALSAIGFCTAGEMVKTPAMAIESIVRLCITAFTKQPTEARNHFVNFVTYAVLTPFSPLKGVVIGVKNAWRIYKEPFTTALIMRSKNQAEAYIYKNGYYQPTLFALPQEKDVHELERKAVLGRLHRFEQRVRAATEKEVKRVNCIRLPSVTKAEAAIRYPLGLHRFEQAIRKRAPKYLAEKQKYVSEVGKCRDLASKLNVHQAWSAFVEKLAKAKKMEANNPAFVFIP
jgi:hypothetical protein